MINWVAAFLLFLPTFVFAVGGPAGLPPAIQQRLNEEYPGWKIAIASKAVWESFKQTKQPDHPNILATDFDKDGKLDWAIQIALVTPGEEEQFVTVFLERDGGYEELIVESRGLDPAVYLTKRKKTFSEAVSGKDQMSNRTELVIRGGPMGDSAYYWENGQFREAPSDTTEIPPMENQP